MTTTEHLHVVLLRYTRPIEEIEAATPDHRAWLDEHYRSGRFVVSGPRDPRTGGVILATGDKESLAELLKGDPFAQRDLAEYEIVSFVPVKRGVAFGLTSAPIVE